MLLRLDSDACHLLSASEKYVLILFVISLLFDYGFGLVWCGSHHDDAAAAVLTRIREGSLRRRNYMGPHSWRRSRKPQTIFTFPFHSTFNQAFTSRPLSRYHNRHRHHHSHSPHIYHFHQPSKYYLVLLGSWMMMLMTERWWLESSLSDWCSSKFMRMGTEGQYA